MMLVRFDSKTVVNGTCNGCKAKGELSAKDVDDGGVYCKRCAGKIHPHQRDNMTRRQVLSICGR